jgi:subtilisin family serine protease
MTKRSPSIRIVTILAVATLVLTALSLLMTQGFAAPPIPPADKIEAGLLDRLTTEGPADLVVRFAEQPDLSAAYRMNWVDRGEFVYRTLYEAAAGSQKAAQSYLDSRGLRYQTFVAGNELYIWTGDLDAVNALAAMREVASLRLARTYYLDPILSKAEVTAAPNALAWGITDTKANQFWATFGVQGDGILVANIDTGVQWNHPALDQSYKCAGDPGNAACWADPSNICGGTPCDNNGHGSHTMGTMVGDDDPSLTWQAGMAPNAQWIACKGCESSSCSDYALSACGDWLLQPGGSTANRPHVVNNSWGGSGGENWYLAKVNAWRAAGIFPAFSAGNEGSGCSTLGSPGDYQESFASAAHDSGRAIASFSSRGPSAFGHDPYTKPNISAPGVNVCSTVPTDGWSCGYSGTSMASPHTAGAVALLWSCNPSLIGQIDSTFQYLQNTANAAPAGNCGAPPDGQGNYTFGYGYLDILAAGQAYCTPPVTPTPTNTPGPTSTPIPPVTPIDWVNLPLVARNAAVGPTVTSTPQPTPGPTFTPRPGIAILLVSPDCSEGDISGLLSALGQYPDHQVTVWDNNLGNPGLGNLTPYEVVIVGNDILWSAAGLDKNAIGNVLADYLDQGGNVIESMYVQSYDVWGFGGRYLSGGYSPFKTASLDSWYPDSMTVLDPSHPIMAGVTSINDFWGHQDPGLRAGSTLLARWTTTSYGAVAVKGTNVVALNQLIFHDADWSGDVPLLLHNAIVWLTSH